MQFLGEYNSAEFKKGRKKEECGRIGWGEPLMILIDNGHERKKWIETMEKEREGREGWGK